MQANEIVPRSTPPTLYELQRRVAADRRCSAEALALVIFAAESNITEPKPADVRKRFGWSNKVRERVQRELRDLGYLFIHSEHRANGQFHWRRWFLLDGQPVLLSTTRPVRVDGECSETSHEPIRTADKPNVDVNTQVNAIHPKGLVHTRQIQTVVEKKKAEPVVSKQPPSSSPRPARPGTAFAELRQRLNDTGHLRKTHGTQLNGFCPAHEDQQASLTLREGPDSALLHCHAGCDVRDVLAAIGLTPADLYDRNWSSDHTGITLSSTSPRRLEPLPTVSTKTSSPVVDTLTFVYEDETGSPRMRVMRRLHADGQKSRVAEHWSGNAWKPGSASYRGLYRLPEVLACDHSADVHLTEGERDADTLSNMGFVATTPAFGAKAWSVVSAHRNGWVGILQGRHLAVWMDRDAVGRKRAETIVKVMFDTAASIVVWRPRHGNDVCDHFEAGGDFADAVLVGVPTSSEWRVPPEHCADVENLSSDDHEAASG